MKKLLLIDANSIIHRCYHALPPLTSPGGEPAGALYGVASILLKILLNNPPEYAAACFDRPEPTFRKQKFEEYKAQRPKAPDDLISQIISARNIFNFFGIKVFEAPGFEADDLIATLASVMGMEKDLEVEILTGDRDTLQLVSGDKIKVRFFRRGISDTVVYDENQVRKDFGLEPRQLIEYKMLIGDSSDNIKGIPGVGPKTAQAILSQYGNLAAALSSSGKDGKLDKIKVLRPEELDLLRELIVLRKDAPVGEVKLADLFFSTDKESLAENFKALGFDSLIKRLHGQEEVYKPKDKKNKTDNSQGRMF